MVSILDSVDYRTVLSLQKFLLDSSDLEGLNPEGFGGITVCLILELFLIPVSFLRIEKNVCSAAYRSE